jgi:prepilin-type N-terminal cleavage/methylation domain-containing protein
MYSSTKRGFTLIELLVVISIIGMLSSAVLVGVVSAHKKGLISKTNSQLFQIRNAISLLEHDTGKWPNGCFPGKIIYDYEAPAGSTNEVDLADDSDDATGGLIRKPPTGINDPGVCEWTDVDIEGWSPNYIDRSALIDPWGNDIWFDNDYEYPGCPGDPTPKTIAVIVSAGPDGIGPTFNSPDDYGCDNIFLNLE